MCENVDRRDCTQDQGHRALIGVMGTLTDEEKNSYSGVGEVARQGMLSGRSKSKIRCEDMGEDMIDFNSFWSDNANGNAVKIWAESASGNSYLNGIKSVKTYKDIGGWGVTRQHEGIR
ncbi:predicted protein [Aspergillus nidulans FGSC A4]|uniref:Uncharacterized protein n=1 Tax=Emericella nidulans (strain FGSC A4 / ATCC 38163 / CBS 112.46 / NRRL 194 / M139) TaxID=227321 RepID=Q5AUR7_EMENI|nr:hypothetical protein [Aspergillus nidulans FGSC A4]EAA59617.1 predicted protein [Aspergillus nidulans FGSC A4]CBF73607.1 TPA: conserved hypothetical protein [Aspergillus nidulans FGSC A4]|eukprot:XP_681232.1 predicted protein [Aspergillus nidulans FGSC A4]